MSKRIRTFIAVEIEPAVRNELVSLQDELRDVAGDVKWVEPDNLHLTLKFLGDVDETDLYSVCKMAAQSVADFDPFAVQLAGVGAFPNHQRPRIIWAGIRQGAAELSAIQQSIEMRFKDEGYPREDRGFTPHLTLGRAKQPISAQPLIAAIERLADWDGGLSAVDEIVVMASQLTSHGPVYAVMGRGPLAVK